LLQIIRRPRQLSHRVIGAINGREHHSQAKLQLNLALQVKGVAVKRRDGRRVASLHDVIDEVAAPL
jgi:hypothetical protein